MLAHLLAPLNGVLFRLGNDQVTAAELLGFAGWWQWLNGGRERCKLEVARSGARLLRVGRQAPARATAVRVGGA